MRVEGERGSWGRCTPFSQEVRKRETSLRLYSPSNTATQSIKSSRTHPKVELHKLEEKKQPVQRRITSLTNGYSVSVYI